MRRLLPALALSVALCGNLQAAIDTYEFDNEADRQRHAKLTHRLNKLDLALLQAHTNALLMEHF